MKMKYRKKIIIVVAIFVVIIVLGVFNLLFSYKISFNNAELIYYPSLEISQENIDSVNSNAFIEDSGLFNEAWEVPDKKNQKYGELFEIILRYNVCRYVKTNDYIIEKTIDFSRLKEDEKIFFAKSTGLTDDFVFASSGDSLTAPTYIDLWGYSSGKEIDEIKEIINKLSIVFIVQNKNGKIEKKHVDIKNINIECRDADYNDIDTVTRLLGWNNNY